MKFKDPQTGKVFENINSARRNYCPYKGGFPCPESCNLSAASNGGTSKCSLIWLEENKREAAHLMGYEVIEDDDPKEKPHICEVLGVEVGEKFTFPYPNKVYDECYVRDDGTVWSRNPLTKTENRVGAPALCWLINHVETVQKIQKLTDKEIEICRGLGAKWVSKDIRNDGYVQLWSERPMIEYAYDCYGEAVEKSLICDIISTFFESVKPGDCICVEGLNHD